MVLRDAEVHHLEHAGIGHEEVVRLHVAVDDARVVRRLQPAAGLHQVADRLRERHRPAHPFLKTLPAKQLHADVAVRRVQTDVVETDDVRVHELPGKLQLLLEAGHCRIRGSAKGEDLESHVLFQLQVARAEHDRHASLPDLLLQAVAARDGDARREAFLGGSGPSVRQLRGLERGAAHHGGRRQRPRRIDRREIVQIRQAGERLAVVVRRVPEHGRRDHRGCARLRGEAREQLAHIPVSRGARLDLLQRLLGVLREVVPEIEPGEQVERLRLDVVLRSFAHESSDEVLELEPQRVETTGELHRAHRGGAIAGILARHAHQVVERLPGVARVEVGLRCFEREPGVGVQLRCVRAAPHPLRHPGRVRVPAELDVRVESEVQLPRRLELLGGEYVGRRPTHRDLLGLRQQRGRALRPLARHQPRGADLIARPLQRLHRALPFPERDEQLDGHLRLASFGEPDGRAQRAPLQRRFELPRLRRPHSQRAEQRFPRLAVPAGRREQAGHVFHRSGLAERAQRLLGLSRLLERAGLLVGGAVHARCRPPSAPRDP